MGSPSKPRIFALHRLPAPVEARLEALGAVSWNLSDQELSPADLIQEARGAEALVSTVTDPLPATVFEALAPTLKIIANFGVGFDLIDREAARKNNVIVTNTPGVLTDCTADLTMALILMTMRRLGEGERLVRDEQWRGWKPTHMLGGRVAGKTLGIIGMGRIGRAVADRAKFGFGMRIIYHSRSPLSAATRARWEAENRSVDDLLREADVVSLHCPATAETRGMLDARRIALMPRHAVLINTARGALVDETALIEAVRSGRLRGAGLDVYQTEPEVPAEMLDLENLVLLPHLGSATRETREAMGNLVVENLSAFFRGETPPNVVA